MVAAVALLAGPAVAQEPSAVALARSAGLVGERFDGYVGFVTPPSETLRRQVNAVNIRRRALYASLAARKGASTQEVGITATCTIFPRIPIGGYYLTSGGSWQRRAVGQPPLRPSYCG